MKHHSTTQPLPSERNAPQTQTSLGHAPTDQNRNAYQKVVSQIEAGHLESALHTAESKGPSDLAMKNACGVCLLRLGKYSQAVHVYRGLVMAPDGLALRDDVPEALKLNFATALILDGKSSGGIDVLRQLDASHPDVERVRQELRHWERQLGFWNRTMWRLGIGPQRSVELGDAPGVLL